MGIRDLAKADAQDITTDLNGWAANITITKPGEAAAVIQGLHSKIHLNMDSEGNVVSTKKATVSFSEGALPWSIRYANQEVDLYDFIYEVADSTGVVKKYSSKLWLPDELVGLIVVMLDNYE